MKKSNTNKRTLFILIPLLWISMLAFVLLPRSTKSVHVSADDIGSSIKSNYDVDDQKHEAPTNDEPVFVSIFKFIVNCNPFRKETQL